MDTTATTIAMLFEKAEDYTRTTAELLKLTTIDKSADVLSSLGARLAIATVVAMFFLLLNFGFALWLGEYLGEIYLGFFIVAGSNLFLAILMYLFRNQWLKSPISTVIILKMLKK
ncbi:hypothetical protein [Flavobacterium restrictum]|uniref:Phage holin family protein n=1 Tax=Flavobacterium restrictum TaxID=2594428 RepID=A0A553DXX6_9FLAO|nr:hypothetical protein [Flavobacterium restrictum]TRX37545.1 hypothetical protein FNW21_12230 [Flavobacterium restrictum]